MRKWIQDRYRNSEWGFWEVLVALSFGLLTAYFFYLEREIYRLQVVLLAETSLEVEQSVADKVTIHYEDQVVDNLSSIHIRLENVGNQAIKEDDYARPIKFIFPHRATVVEAKVIDSFPTNIGPELRWEGNQAELLPVLLNPEDRMVIQFIVVDTSPRVVESPLELDVRIVGVPSVEVISVISERSEAVEKIAVRYTFPVWGFLVVVILSSLILGRGNLSRWDRAKLVMLVFLCVLVAVLMFQVLLRVVQFTLTF